MINKRVILLAIILLIGILGLLSIEYTGFSTSDNETQSEDQGTNLEDLSSDESEAQDSLDNPPQEDMVEQPPEASTQEDSNETDVEEPEVEEDSNETQSEDFNETEVEELNETLSDDLNETISEDTNETETSYGSSSTDSFSNLTQVNATSFNITAIQINDTIHNLTITETTSKPIVVINRPVKWTKTVKLSNKTKQLDVEVPKDAENIIVNKIEGDLKEEISPIKIDIEGETQLVSLGFSWLEYLFRKTFSLTGYATLDSSEENKTITIDEEVEEVEIEYETPGPVAVEEELNDYNKRITISSDIAYENVLTFMTINEAPQESIKLYWLINGTKELFEDVTYYDEDNNGLVELIEWITPHLSDQIFEVEITIINVQSYPQVGGNWTVEFNTTGTADLIITAINGTTFGSEYPADINFIELKCGNIILDPTYEGGIVNYPDFNCNETASEISHVITSGSHHLQFEYGGVIALAHNYAKDDCSGTEPIATVWNISANTVCQNTHISLDGNLTINDGYSLTLQNVTLELNSSRALEREIRALSGSTLIIQDLNNVASTIRTNSSQIKFVAERGSSITLQNSLFNNIGDYTGLGGSANNLEDRGIFINSTNSIISGNTIISNLSDAPLIIASNDNEVTNNIISGMSFLVDNALGMIYLFEANNNTISNNDLSNNKGDSGSLKYITTSINLQNSHNNTISNNDLTATNDADATLNGIKLTDSNYTNIINNIISGNTLNGIMFVASAFNNVSDHTIFSVAGAGINLGSSQNNTFINITIQGDNLDSDQGIELLTNSDNNIFKNLNITDVGTDGIYIRLNSIQNYIYNSTIYGSSSIGLRFRSNINSNYATNVVVSNSGTADIRIHPDATGYFLNTTFLTTQLNTNGRAIIQWYLDININDSNSNNLQNVNVTVWDSTNDFIFSELTNSNGIILTKNLIEYVANETNTIFSTNYTINTTYNDFPIKTQQQNLTTNIITPITFTSHSTPTLNYPTNNTFTTNGTVLLKWNNSTKGDHNIIGYTLEIDNNNDFSSPEYTIFNITETASPTSYQTSNITTDSLYYWRVLATDNSLNSSFTTENVFTLDRIDPIVNLISPLNNRGDKDGNITLNYNVTDTNSISNCSLIINTITNQTNTSITKSITQNITELNLPISRYSWTVNCTDQAANTFQPIAWNFSIFRFKSFTGGSNTNVETISISNVSNFIIEKTDHGKINFTQNLDLSNGTSIDDYVNISFNRISIDSENIPELNKSAKISFYGITFDNPSPLMDGQPCSSSICSSRSYSEGVYTMTVSSFSIYSLEETPSSVIGSSSSNRRRIEINKIESEPGFPGKKLKLHSTLENRGPRTEENITLEVTNCPTSWKCSQLDILTLKRNEPTIFTLGIDIPLNNILNEYDLNIEASNNKVDDEKNYKVIVNPSCTQDYECGDDLCINNICQSPIPIEIINIDSNLSRNSDLDFTLQLNNNLNITDIVTLEYYLDNILIKSKNIYLETITEITDLIKLKQSDIGTKTFKVKAYTSKYSSELSTEINILDMAELSTKATLNIEERFVNKPINYILDIFNNKDNQQSIRVSQTIYSSNNIEVFNSITEESITKKLTLKESNINLMPDQYTLKIEIDDGIKKQSILKSFVVNSTVITGREENKLTIILTSIILIIFFILFTLKNGRKNNKRHKRCHRKKH